VGDALSTIEHWQTLIAAVLQIGIAFAALWPVYRQLGLARLQSAITLREVLIERAEFVERERTDAAKDIWRVVTDVLEGTIFPFSSEEPATDINAEWALGAEQQVSSLRGKFESRLDSHVDPQIIDVARARVVDALRSMEGCLSDLHQWASVHFDDPDYGFADPAAEQARAEVARDDATKTVGPLLNVVEASVRELDRAFETQSKDFRTRIRQIDSLVLRYEQKKIT
jgi:hypothetical protein